MSAEWRPSTLGRVATLQRGFDLPHRKRTRGDVPVVTSSGFGDTHGVAAVKGPGVVTGRYGTIGEVFYVQADFWPLNTTLFVRDFHGNDPLFISYLLRTVNFQSHSGKSGVPGVNRNDIHELVVQVPSPDEQRRIASALSDIDALLNKLDQLIAKKRDIKQAAMQQLLTGHIRLPGCTGEWQLTRLGELATLTMGGTPSRRVQAFWGAGYMWASIADMKGKVLNETAEQITETGAAGLTIIPKGTLLMSFKLSIGRLCFAGCDLFTNEAICAFRKLKASASFLYYALQRVDFSQYGKQAVKGYTLNKQSLNAVEISLPEDREQDAIAQVLSDMDAEIEALEARRDKTRQLKQGMMQALLTGRIRLT